jgi:hypothetical protein
MVIIPEFINVLVTATINEGWKNILIIPNGTVTIANALNPSQSMSITAPLAIGNDTQNADVWGNIVITGVAEVIVNGSATAN